MKYFFFHKRFGKDFYNFAFAFIWLYVIQLIYGWRRCLSAHCANSGSLVKWEKLKPQIILKCNEMFTGIKFSKQQSWHNGMPWAHLIKHFINFSLAVPPPAPTFLELLSVVVTAVQASSSSVRLEKVGLGTWLSNVSDGYSIWNFAQTFWSFWKSTEPKLKTHRLSLFN